MLKGIENEQTVVIKQVCQKVGTVGFCGGFVGGAKAPVVTKCLKGIEVVKVGAPKWAIFGEKLLKKVFFVRRGLEAKAKTKNPIVAGANKSGRKLVDFGIGVVCPVGSVISGNPKYGFGIFGVKRDYEMRKQRKIVLGREVGCEDANLTPVLGNVAHGGISYE